MAGLWRNILIITCTVLYSVDADWRAIHTQNRTTPLYCAFDESSSSFTGSTNQCNTSLRQVFKLLHVDSNIVLIGSTNCLYALDRDLTSVRSVNLSIESTDLMNCEGSLSADADFRCQNYIAYADTVNGQLDTTSFRVCGTYNSLQPRCWMCSLTDTALSCSNSSQTNFMPRRPDQNFTVINGDNDFYYLGGLESFIQDDGILAKIEIADRDISTAPVDTDSGDQQILKYPVNFVGSIDRGDYIYFFFRESAYEYTSIMEVAFARVARVCKNDTGGTTNPLNDQFTTFLKTRLMCSVGADFPFIFNELQDVKLSSNQAYVYGLFTTAMGGPSSSAICRYNMAELDMLFNTDFRRGQTSATELWQRIPRDAGDTLAARTCTVAYDGDPDVYRHLKNFPLLNTNAPNCGLGRTCNDFRRASHDALAVFEGIRGQQLVLSVESGSTIEVFVGTNNHTIYEATVSPSDVVITRQIEIQAAIDSFTDLQKGDKWPFGVDYLEKNGNLIFGTLDNCAFHFQQSATEALFFRDRSPPCNYTHPVNIPGATTLVFKLIEGPDGSNMNATFSGELAEYCQQRKFKSSGARKREFIHVSCTISGLMQPLNGDVTISSLSLGDTISPLDIPVSVTLDTSEVNASVDPAEVNQYDIEMAKYRYRFQEWLGNVTCPDAEQQTCPSANGLG